MSSLSIIMATSGRPRSLQETLANLCATPIPAGIQAELILVENGQRLGAEELVRSLPSHRFAAVKYLFELRAGKSRALNLALTHAVGEILVFTDDDVRFPSEWLERMCRPIL